VQESLLTGLIGCLPASFKLKFSRAKHKQNHGVASFLIGYLPASFKLKFARANPTPVPEISPCRITPTGLIGGIPASIELKFFVVYVYGCGPCCE
jgi:hypothetical protein